MPYEIRKKGPGQYAVVNKQTGKTKGTTHTRTKAQKMIAAIYANGG